MFKETYSVLVRSSFQIEKSALASFARQLRMGELGWDRGDASFLAAPVKTVEDKWKLGKEELSLSSSIFNPIGHTSSWEGMFWLFLPVMWIRA